MASARAAMDLRGLLDHDSDALVKGLALVGPRQRAELRRVLDLADSMSGTGAEGESRVNADESEERR
jgi:hypothetical protein